MDDGAEDRIQVQHVYDFSRLDRLPEGPTSLKVVKSAAAGPVLTGSTLVCTLGSQPAGTGAKAHADASEQFNYIVQGTMMSDIAGDRVFASKGMILHIPPGAAHSRFACPDGPLVFLSITDARGGIAPAVDANDGGPDAFAGYGSRSGEPRVTTSDILEQSMKLAPGPGKRYVYDMRKPDDASAQPASAEVTPDANLRLPPRITGKLLSGERLHVIVLRLEPGASLSNYRKDNEQLVFAAEGELDVDLEEEHRVLPRRCLLHIPKGTRHELVAPHGALIVIAQDKGG